MYWRTQIVKLWALNLLLWSHMIGENVGQAVYYPVETVWTGARTEPEDRRTGCYVPQIVAAADTPLPLSIDSMCRSPNRP
jgi:hypothetical protein